MRKSGAPLLGMIILFKMCEFIYFFRAACVHKAANKGSPLLKGKSHKKGSCPNNSQSAKFGKTM
jgi:hypothetical protein